MRSAGCRGPGFVEDEAYGILSGLLWMSAGIWCLESMASGNDVLVWWAPIGIREGAGAGAGLRGD